MTPKRWQDLFVDSGMEISRVLGEYHIAVQGAPPGLKVQILEYPAERHPHGNLEGACNYDCWRPSQGDPYGSSTLEATEVEALQDALMQVHHMTSGSDPPEVCFWVRVGDGVIFDGNGTQVSKDEAKRRRKEYQIR